MKEATIIINGRALAEAQSMSVRVAVTMFLSQLKDKHFSDSLGQLGISYQTRLDEVLELINDTKVM